MLPAHTEEFSCFGGSCSVTIEGEGPRGTPAEAVRWARAQLLGWHVQFTRFDASSELSQLNADPRATVPASPLMVELAAAVRVAGDTTGGLVDGTLISALEAAGYAEHLPHAHPIDGAEIESWDAEPHRPAAPSPLRDWAMIAVDRAAGTIMRPPGVRLDSGGLVKGLLADILCGWLSTYDDVVVDCCGDVRFGGSYDGVRDVEIEHPFGGLATTIEVADGAIATSGTTGRRWTRPDGQPGHHLLDPATGLPARTGLIQVSAFAPSALEAEVLAKWALLSGPEAAASRLVYGGVIVDEAGDVREIPPAEQRLMLRGAA